MLNCYLFYCPPINMQFPRNLTVVIAVNQKPANLINRVVIFLSPLYNFWIKPFLRNIDIPRL